MASPHIQAEQDSLNALNGSQAQIKALPRDQSQHQPQDEDQAPSIEPGLPSPSLKDHPSPHLPALAFTTSSSPPRDLPSKNRLAADNFEDAYVQFIFYCNPALSTSLSTTELRRGFNAVPRADGKSFEIFALFRLVERFERGEVGTWNALVVELGVERPDTEKGQSTQKLGQYAVRLKRWLHAFHIDAFFQYCLSKPNDYYTTIPVTTAIAVNAPRDGVEPEDDLALRALIPNFRPKRGRRKEDEDKVFTPTKRLRVKMSTFDQSRIHTSLVRDSPQPSSQPSPEMDAHNNHSRVSYPHSALPSYSHDAYMADAWASASRAFKVPGASPPSSATPPFYFNPGPPPYISPWSGYPHSAIESHPPPNVLSSERDGSQSAHPLSHQVPEKGSGRKRPGSNVSAAWKSNLSRIAAGKTGRGKGRPPQNRAVYNGPYATFPSSVKDLQKVHEAERGGAAAGTLPVGNTEAESTEVMQDHVELHSQVNAPHRPPQQEQQQQQKPSKLSLQVPRHPSGNVRLATPPPPKVVVNDGDGTMREDSQARLAGRLQTMTEGQEGSISTEFFTRIDEESSEMWEEDEERGEEDDEGNESGRIDWKRKAQFLQRKLREAQAELKAVKRRVMEAVM